MIGPHRQVLIVEARVTRRRSEEKYVLFGGLNFSPDRLMKELSHPGSARKHEAIHYTLTRDARRQKSAFGLEDTPLHLLKIDLRPSFRQFARGQPLVRNS